MNIDEVSQEAEEWISKTESQLKLFRVDKSENRLNFEVANENISFYIIFTEEEKQLKWHLWSEIQDVLAKLTTTIEDVTGNRLKSITDILSSCQSNIFKTDGAEGGKKKEATNDDVEEAEEEDEEDDDEGDDGYYAEADDFIDDIRDTVNTGQHNDSDDDIEEDESFFGPMKKAANPAIHRLQKDLKNILKVGPSYGFTAIPRGDNLFVWDVKLIDVPSDCRLGKDLHQYSTKYKQEPVLNLEMQFPPEYPFSPPFIRVIKPRFKFLTGHVTIGGSICMEMLTKSGWVPSNDIESILIQVRAEIMSDSNASLDLSRPNVAYTEQEARDAFNRMVQRYGWNK